jgi:hypothetical protein
MEGENDYAVVLLAWMSILTKWWRQQMILMVDLPRGVTIVVVLFLGEEEGGYRSIELHFGCFELVVC